MVQPLESREFDTQRLVIEHPPVWQHPNKVAVYDSLCPAGSRQSGRLRYSRWPTLPLPERIDVKASLEKVQVQSGFYDYAPLSTRADAVEWHVNFADPHLFVAYGSPLFAQDEMQVAEHPALGSLKEALVATGSVTLTVERGLPTPILVAGVERRGRIDTTGLYGNAFARAPMDVVRRATNRLDPPTITNVIAIAAPTGGGRYTSGQIEHILKTAASGFRAAVIDSSEQMGHAAPVVVHSGFWGCGAFGGNRVLMLTLQIAAAGAAGVAQLVLHTGEGGEENFKNACSTLGKMGDSPCSPTDLIARVSGLGFEWGESDGN
jgi:poly(ADP-ribose)glycohydrolase PARG